MPEDPEAVRPETPRSAPAERMGGLEGERNALAPDEAVPVGQAVDGDGNLVAETRIPLKGD